MNDDDDHTGTVWTKLEGQYTRHMLCIGAGSYMLCGIFSPTIQQQSVTYWKRFLNCFHRSIAKNIESTKCPGKEGVELQQKRHCIAPPPPGPPTCDMNMPVVFAVTYIRFAKRARIAMKKMEDDQRAQEEDQASRIMQRAWLRHVEWEKMRLRFTLRRKVILKR